MHQFNAKNTPDPLDWAEWSHYEPCQLRQTDCRKWIAARV